jgi:serine phosphatase RsbU (regulator of sigma subunit)
VGGDFFDWYEIDGGLGFTLGDVMGKGAGAGMIAATTRAVIRSARNSEDPATALSLTADCLTTELSEAASFATLFHARLLAEDGRILFSDARSIGDPTVIRSDTDPFVPPAASDDLARRLDARLQVHPGAGHSMKDDGVTSLPALLDLILSR